MARFVGERSNQAGSFLGSLLFLLLLLAVLLVLLAAWQPDLANNILRPLGLGGLVPGDGIITGGGIGR